MLPFIEHRIEGQKYGVKNPSKKQFVDRWKFDVCLPDWDANILFEKIKDSQYVDQNNIKSRHSPGQHECNITFEVTSPGFSEEIKQYIINHYGWIFTIDYMPGPIETYFIKEEDIKMPKVKTQAPTHYPTFRKFTKVIRSGPVTVAWIEGKKFLVRKAKKDKDDLEKAMLMLFAKSQFSSEAAFHRWFRDQMKLFEEANNNAKN